MSQPVDKLPQKRSAAGELDITFPADLPVVEKREDIGAAIAAHQVVIVAGETGSGKTTQLPKICLQLGRGSKGMIGHTQPRRLAASTVARRIAEELGEEIGNTVGYQVRFADQVSASSRVKLMTDGILLAEIQRDRLLRRYDTLIIDEAHERSLNIDFLLGYLKRLLPKRPDLKLVITSATIDVESFSAHFDDAPVIEVSGRSYPIETHYLDPADSDDGVVAPAVSAIESILARDFGPPGDILVFLSGEREIRELAKQLRSLPDLDVLPLYARLSNAEQTRVFNPGRRRGVRAVLATNVAETSLTVPGIRYVVDTGYARISRYSYRTRLQRLPIEAISQASANQRQGRCGRVGPGVCLRLYSEADFQARPEFTEPEIQRTNLAAVILRMLQLGLGEVAQFPFINPPDRRLISDGHKLLQELGALQEGGKLNDAGRKMANLPVDPRLARMLLAAAQLDCLAEVLVIVSALSIQDPRERPAEKRQAADEKHRRFNDERSDFLSWVTLWQYFEEQRQALSQNQLRKLCKREYLAFMRMREWRDIHFQLTVACRQAGLRQNREPANYESIHRALLGGLLSNIAQWREGREYLGARSRKMQLFPGSALIKKRPRWLVAAEIVETSSVFARCVADIEPAWALDINPSLLKHSYSEPHWHARSGRVMAYQRSSLYGLVLKDRQRVHYGPIDREVSRDILIRAGLVEGRMRQAPAFLRHNLELIAELEALESRFRRRDLVADEQRIVGFYDQRLPETITTTSRLKAWLKRAPDAREALRMRREDLLLRDLNEELGNQFPDELEWEDMELPLTYHFEPGHPEDGVSVTIPLGLLNRVPRYRFEWLIPGLLREKCIALVKGLPKAQRKHLVPVPDHVDRLLATVEPTDRPLTEVLSERLQATMRLRISAEEWPTDRLDNYYRMNVRVVDAEGRLIRQGRDLAALIELSRDETRASLRESAEVDAGLTGLKRWDFDDLPAVSRSEQAGVAIESFPALIDCGDSVKVEALDYRWEAELEHRAGLIRLYRLACADPVRYLRKQLLKGNAASLALAGAGMQRDELLDDLVNACFDRAVLDDAQLPRSRREFDAALAKGRGELVSWGNEYERVLLDALSRLGANRQRMLSIPDSQAFVLEDLKQQLAHLFAPGFLYNTPWSWLQQYPRYMKSLDNRLQRLSGQVQKDRQHVDLLATHWEPLAESLSRQPKGLLINPELRRYRWLVEELRVSLYSQSLGTVAPVSSKRLAEQWGRVEQWEIQNPA